jgi:hypothetical protein
LTVGPRRAAATDEWDRLRKQQFSKTLTRGRMSPSRGRKIGPCVSGTRLTANRLEGWMPGCSSQNGWGSNWVTPVLVLPARMLSCRWTRCSLHGYRNARSHRCDPSGVVLLNAACGGRMWSVDIVHTLGLGLGRIGVGSGRIPHDSLTSQCLQGWECSSSPTSGTQDPSSEGFLL